MTYVSLDELGEVGVPNVINMRPFEQCYSSFICLPLQERKIGSLQDGAEEGHFTLKASSK